MSDLVLPLDRFESDTHIKALENLVKRFEQKEEPVHYKRAALSNDESTVSSCLNYFNKLGIIEQPGKRGIYKPPIATIEFFNNGESSLQELIEIVRNDPVFEEAQFMRGQGIQEIEELADSVASQLDMSYEDEFDIEDDRKKVLRALEIFDELGLFNEGDTETSESTEKETKESTGTAPSEEVSIEMGDGDDYQLKSVPPQRANPDRLLKLCSLLKQGGTWSIDDINDELDFPNEDYIYQTIDYGEALGFLITDEDGKVKASSNGFELAYEEEITETAEELFQDGVSNYDQYVALVSVVVDDIELGEDGLLKKDELLKTIRTELKLTDPSDDMLNRAVSTFFDTLEAAGFGEVKNAGGGYPKRLSYDDGSVLIQDIWGSVDIVDESANEDNKKSVESDAEQDGGSETESEEQIRKSENGNIEKANEENRDANPPADAQLNSSSRSIRIDMEITLDLAEIDSEDLESKLTQLDAFLQDRDEVNTEDI